MHKKKINTSRGEQYIDIPDTCPHCGRVMALDIVHHSINAERSSYYLLAQCTVSECLRYFPLEYHILNENSWSDHHLKLIPYTFDGAPVIEIPEDIKKLSPEFAMTYSQALIAESKNLTNIIGVSLRKAFEFLIKDFAMRNLADDEKEKIKTLNINNVIDKYYKEMATLQTMLHITRKLGNDETHYYRAYTNTDVQDLKKLIHNFSLHITMILDVEEYSQKLEEN